MRSEANDYELACGLGPQPDQDRIDAEVERRIDEDREHRTREDIDAQLRRGALAQCQTIVDAMGKLLWGGTHGKGE